jgi:hypothetical protein
MREQRATTPHDGRNSQRRLVDFAGTVFFLLLQAAVFRATLFLLTGRPADLVFYGGILLLMATLGVSIWRLARVRSAAGFAIAGFVLQLGLSALAYLTST